MHLQFNTGYLHSVSYKETAKKCVLNLLAIYKTCHGLLVIFSIH